ncbi:E3 ubiquitin-protein ligase DCST1-like isoform X2 [Apostichopus japonicus]|uniref:E3 ubiquitin-protein ligase DCST1-like isoform X2 n=1 Tax=Stichopus japonicus TaxID=307972 RepID=UPI003AB4BC7C
MMNITFVEQRVIKIFIGCLLGACLGTAFHIYVVNSLPLPSIDKFIFGASLTFVTSIGFGFSRTVRCICLLIVPNFFGKYGRGFLTSAAMMSVLSDMFSVAVQNCKDNMLGIHERCLERIWVPIARQALCAPMTATFVCNVITLLDSVCDASTVDSQNLGREYLKAKKALGKLDEEFHSKMKWKLEKPKLPPIFKSVSISEIQGIIKYEISKRKIWFDVAYKCVSTLLSFTFLLVLLSANTYNKEYLTNLRFDNVYLTEYFQKIDSRRKEKGQKYLLPLKKTEKKEIIKPLVLSLRIEERRKLIKGTIRLSCQVFVTLLLLAFDFFFYTSLDLIHRHSQLDFEFHGEHYFRVSVHGHGKMAQLFQRVFEAFDSQHTIAGISTNKECLPIPSKLPIFQLLYICALWVSVWLFLCFEAWGLRLRRIICAYHYEKREKTRILFLYNDCLRKREGYLRHMRKRVLRLARENRLEEKLGSTSILRSKFPRLCGWMSIVGMGKKTCLVCSEKESKRSYHCVTKGCYFMYCRECWEDIKVCFACSQDKRDESGSGDDSDEGV